MIDNPISYVKNTRKTYSKQYETVLTEVQVQFGNENPAWIPYETLVAMKKFAMTEKSLAMNLVVLGLLMLCVAGIIVGGYIHGDMHFAKVLEHLKK